MLEKNTLTEDIIEEDDDFEDIESLDIEEIETKTEKFLLIIYKKKLF